MWGLIGALGDFEPSLREGLIGTLGELRVETMGNGPVEETNGTLGNCESSPRRGLLRRNLAS